MKKHFTLTRKQLLTRLFTGLSLLVFSFSFMHPTVVSAQVSANQKKLFSDGIGYFDYEDGCSGGVTTAGLTTGGPSGGSSGSDSGSWNSGLQPPYILEQFAIEVLKDLAAKRGVDPSVTVTEEHVVAVVAFMVGEGGDIANTRIFNPLNSTQQADGLSIKDGRIPRYTSFDAGVELTARTMVNPYENRLADILTKKESTGVQFMNTLTYYNNYPGNKVWAIESQQNPAGYYAERITLLNRVRAGYDNYASIIIGTDKLEQNANMRDKTKLKFHPAGQTAAPAPSGATDGGSAVQASCATTVGTGNASGGCKGGEELTVPQGGVGVNVCYFAQCAIGMLHGFSMCGCGCEPTSVMMIRATMEGNPGIDKGKVLDEIKAAGGLVGCAGAFPRNWLKGYLGPLGYDIQKVHDRVDGPRIDPAKGTQALTDADLAKAKEMLGKGYLLLAHTPNFVVSNLTNPTSGHYLIVRAVDAQGNFYVANPGTNSAAEKTRAISPQNVKQWLDEFYAVKKTGTQV